LDDVCQAAPTFPDDSDLHDDVPCECGRAPASSWTGGRANASGLNTADCLPGLAECFQDKANLVAQACFDIFAVLNAVLDQNRVEE
jgi:hypothetical protein